MSVRAHSHFSPHREELLSNLSSGQRLGESSMDAEHIELIASFLLQKSISDIETNQSSNTEELTLHINLAIYS